MNSDKKINKCIIDILAYIEDIPGNNNVLKKTIGELYEMIRSNYSICEKKDAHINDLQKSVSYLTGLYVTDITTIKNYITKTKDMLSFSMCLKYDILNPMLSPSAHIQKMKDCNIKQNIFMTSLYYVQYVDNMYYFANNQDNGNYLSDTHFQLNEEHISGACSQYHEVNEEQFSGACSQYHEVNEEPISGTCSQYHEVNEEQFSGACSKDDEVPFHIADNKVNAELFLDVPKLYKKNCPVVTKRLNKELSDITSDDEQDIEIYNAGKKVFNKQWSDITSDDEQYIEIYNAGK
jgi:hypothetical protein